MVGYSDHVARSPSRPAVNPSSSTAPPLRRCCNPRQAVSRDLILKVGIPQGKKRRRKPSFLFTAGVTIPIVALAGVATPGVATPARRGQPVLDSAVSMIGFGRVEAARFKPGLEPVLCLVVPRGAGDVVGARMDVWNVTAVHPARQRQPGRKQGSMEVGHRRAAARGCRGERSAASLVFLNVHYYLISG